MEDGGLEGATLFAHVLRSEPAGVTTLLLMQTCYLRHTVESIRVMM